MKKLKWFLIPAVAMLIGTTLLGYSWFNVPVGGSGLLSIGVAKAQESISNPKVPTFVAQPPIVFSETSNYVKLDFTTFTVEFYKGTYGYNKVYDHTGNVLVYDDRAVAEYWTGNKWTQRGLPYSLTWEKIYDEDRVNEYYYKVHRHYMDYLGTTYTLTYTIKSGEAMKLSVTLNSWKADTYRIAWYLSGIQKTTQKTETNRLVFGNEAMLYDWVAFDWNDVYDSLGNITTSSTEVKADGIKASIYFSVGNVGVGQSITLDPSFVANGSSDSGTGAVTPALPVGIVTNDILLLFAESNSGQAVTIVDSGGGLWSQVTGSPQDSTASRLTVFWSRYNGAQTAPTTNDPGDHIIASIAAWRGCITTGNPWDVTSSAVHNTSDTAVSIPGATTTVANCLVVAIVGHGIDGAKVQVNSWANTSLSSLTERLDYSTSSGGGGGFGIAEGGKADAGAYNATTATLAAASTKGLMTIALRPPWEPPVSDIDVGVAPVARAGHWRAGDTLIVKNNPANASGILHSVKVFAEVNLTGLIIGTFYLTNGNSLKCRDSEAIGAVLAGAERTFTELSIAVEAGDYIGCLFTSGFIYRDTVGEEGLWYYLEGEYIDPGDEAIYEFVAGNTISLYGYGDFGGFTADISNAPLGAFGFGILAANSTYYSHGAGAYTNPVATEECYFTLTNNGDTAKINIKETNPEGGVNWTLTDEAPGENTIRDTVMVYNTNPANGVKLTTSDRVLIASLATGTIKWDLQRETGTFTDGALKTSIITLTAVTP